MRPGPIVLALTLAGCRPADLPPPRAAATDPAAVLGGRCERGDGPACVEVAAIHRAAGDLPRAAAYARRACDLASARGCADLAAALERGEGVPASRERALDLYVSACLGGQAEACRATAERIGDDAAAAEFRARACLAGDATLCPPAAEPAPPPIDPRDEAGVVTALAAHRGALRRCYDAARRGRPGLRGRVIVDVAVGPDGRPRAAVVREGLRGAPEVGACVAELAGRTTYAPTTTGEIVVVPYGVVFEPPEE